LLIPNLLFKIKKEKRAAEFAANHELPFKMKKNGGRIMLLIPNLLFKMKKKKIAAELLYQTCFARYRKKQGN
jgi:hypothetical protein